MEAHNLSLPVFRRATPGSNRPQFLAPMTIPFVITLAQTASPAPGGGLGGFAIPMICMVVIFYFMAIRPQSKRQKELANLVAALKTGDKVVTSSGIHGIISNVKEGSTLILKIADNVKIEIDKASIATVVSDDKSSSSAAAA
jgi:preprotein translocase subunit YajC